MFKRSITMCAWCKSIKTTHGFIDMDLEHIEWLKSQPDISILYATCEQCHIRLVAKNTIIYEPYIFNVPEERRCDYV